MEIHGMREFFILIVFTVALFILITSMGIFRSQSDNVMQMEMKTTKDRELRRRDTEHESQTHQGLMQRKLRFISSTRHTNSNYKSASKHKDLKKQTETKRRDSRLQQNITVRDPRLQETVNDRDPRLQQNITVRDPRLQRTVNDRKLRLQKTVNDRERRLQQTVNDRYPRLKQTDNDSKSRLQQPVNDRNSRLQHNITIRDPILQQTFKVPDSRLQQPVNNSEPRLQIQLNLNNLDSRLQQTVKHPDARLKQKVKNREKNIGNKLEINQKSTKVTITTDSNVDAINPEEEEQYHKRGRLYHNVNTSVSDREERTNVPVNLGNVTQNHVRYLRNQTKPQQNVKKKHSRVNATITINETIKINERTSGEVTQNVTNNKLIFNDRRNKSRKIENSSIAFTPPLLIFKEPIFKPFDRNLNKHRAKTKYQHNKKNGENFKTINEPMTVL